MRECQVGRRAAIGSCFQEELPSTRTALSIGSGACAARGQPHLNQGILRFSLFPTQKANTGVPIFSDRWPRDDYLNEDFLQSDGKAPP
jgi:hypothetical protein